MTLKKILATTVVAGGMLAATSPANAAAFTFPGGPPAAARVIRFGAKPIGDDPIDADDFAEFAIRD